MVISSARLRKIINVKLLTEQPQLELELTTRTKNLDIVRGNFQIAMIVNLASDIDESCEFSGDILVVPES